MKPIKHLDYTLAACGISQTSLRRLRDILTSWYKSKVVVIAVVTGDYTYGYLVVENARGDAFWTGDGFRHDGGGEGGAAAVAACALLAIYGVKELQYWEKVDLSEGNELLRMAEGSGVDNSVLKGKEKLKTQFQKIVDEVVAARDYELLASRQPQYIRHLVRR
jgi:hypothetical protein